MTWTIETNTSEGWMDDSDGFGENSTVYETEEEVQEALRDAVRFSISAGYTAEFTASIHVRHYDD